MSHSSKEDILSHLMDEHGRDVWNFIFSLVKNPDTTDDLTQETFVKAFRNLDGFRGESSPKTWLLSIARNAVRDYHKSAFFRKVVLVKNVFVERAAPSAENEVINHFSIEEIWQEVLALPWRLREALVLHFHNGLDVDDIAVVLDISKSAVNSRIHRARKELAKLLERKGGSVHEGSSWLGVKY